MPSILELETRAAEIEKELDTISRTAETFKRGFSSGEKTRQKSLMSDFKSVNKSLKVKRVEAELRERVAKQLPAGSYRNNSFHTSSTTYSPTSESSYFLDMHNAKSGDSEARQRLDRNQREFRDAAANNTAPELRAISTVVGAGGEFAPPVWLINDYIAALRPARATADALTNIALPPGTDLLNVPKITSGTSVALQTSQNVGVQVTDITTTSVSAAVLTIAGGQVFSRQLFDQSPMAGHMDKLLLTDLTSDYARQLGNLVINGTGATGQPTGILAAAGNTISYTSTTPAFMGTGAVYSKIAQAVQTVQTTRYLAPTAIIMHPRRWAWLASQVDTAGRAVILPGDSGPMNASANLDNVGAQGIVGRMFGLPVLADPNVPTTLGAGANQDTIIVMKADDSWLYEGTLKAEIFSETYSNSLGLFARVYNYFALAHRINQSIAVIGGTGLVAPTF